LLCALRFISLIAVTSHCLFFDTHNNRRVLRVLAHLAPALPPAVAAALCTQLKAMLTGLATAPDTSAAVVAALTQATCAAAQCSVRSASEACKGEAIC
jgi:hypothetical protein